MSPAKTLQNPITSPALPASQNLFFVYPVQATWVQLRNLFSLQDEVKVGPVVLKHFNVNY
jgi:hypothetical protein